MVKQLTLDEMAQLAKKVTDWHEISPTDFNGFMDNLRFKCRRIKTIFRLGETAEIYVNYNDRIRGNIYEIGHEKGTQVYSIYKRIEAYMKQSTEKRRREEEVKKEKEEDLVRQDIKERFLGGSE